MTINGIPLSIGEAMTIRVALEHFYAFIADKDALGLDEHGKRMQTAYTARCLGIFRLMTAESPTNGKT